ncbi:hypothetical protein ACX0G9_25220 [Flavitalea flava]
MRILIRYLLSLVVFLQCSFFSIRSLAQAKPDVIIMLSGEKKTGKVLSINDTSIKFSYAGESLEYELKKEQITRIEFGSGRVEVINSPNAGPVVNDKPAATTAPSPEQHNNKVAVLPFEIMSNDPSLSVESLSKQVQVTCVNALRSTGPLQTIQDPNVTNALLAKSKLGVGDLATKTPKEWAEFLGVEYVIMGSYSIQNKGTVSSNSGYSSRDTKKSDDKEKKSTYSYNGGTSYTSASYDTRVTLNIYNLDGNSIYSNTREPAFGSIDSYEPALKYMIKRTPLGKK